MWTNYRVLWCDCDIWLILDGGATCMWARHTSMFSVACWNTYIIFNYNKVYNHNNLGLIHNNFIKHGGSVDGPFIWLYIIIQDCFNFCSCFNYVKLSFVRRDDNTCAHYIAQNVSLFNNVVWLIGFNGHLISMLKKSL